MRPVSHLCLLLLLPMLVAADDPDEPTIRGLPAVFYLPETSLGLGGVAIVSFWGDDDWSPVRLRSTVRLSAIYTVRQQAIIRGQLRLRRQGWPFEINASYDLRSYPDRYYGFGRETSNNYLVYTERSLSVSHWLRFQVVTNIFFSIGITNTWTSTLTRMDQGVDISEGQHRARRGACVFAPPSRRGDARL